MVYILSPSISIRAYFLPTYYLPASLLGPTFCLLFTFLSQLWGCTSFKITLILLTQAYFIQPTKCNVSIEGSVCHWKWSYYLSYSNTPNWPAACITSPVDEWLRCLPADPKVPSLNEVLNSKVIAFVVCKLC